MNFKELLLQAKFGDRTATTELLMLYQPLLLKESIIDGILDEDLYQHGFLFHHGQGSNRLCCNGHLYAGRLLGL